MFLAALLFALVAPPLLTPYERDPAHNTTATYAECIGFYEALAAAYPAQVQLHTAGPTDSGRPLHEVVLSADGTFEPAASRAKNRPVVFIQNGIHPGEPEGIDASMLLARDLLQNPKLRPLLAKITLVILPVYNVDGMLDRGEWPALSRVNQNGPRAYGFRGNARNLDLNRDYVKQDSRNARSFAPLFQKWRPELFVDTHTSDGADYQYTMTLIATQHNKLTPPLSAYLQTQLLPALYAGMERKKWPMTPYVDFAGETPESGLRGFLDSPRYSTGYAALFNSIGFMPEAHMLKPFGQRVPAMYALLTTFLETAAAQAPALLAARTQADQTGFGPSGHPVAWTLRDTASSTIRFWGYEAGHKPSAVSGEPRLYYDRTRPYVRPVPYYNEARPTVVAGVPAAYLIPEAWPEILDNLRRNGVKLRRVTRDGGTHYYLTTYIKTYQTATQPYEGHYPHSQVKTGHYGQNSNPHFYSAGTYVAVLAEQGPAARYLVETLDPQATDSFFAWGFFDSLLQQKEHYSDYVFEDVAANELAESPDLRRLLEAAKQADPKLAASGAAQLNWVYRHTLWFEHRGGVYAYPVVSVWGELPATKPE